MWATTYQSIYLFNALLENAQISSALSQPVRNQLKAHGLFGRALLHYFLVNLFDAVPMITTTDWRSTHTQGQATTTQIYPQLINDLQQAIELLPGAYEPLQGGRLVANKYAAMVLLARIYAQQKDWQQVSLLCDQVINSGLYELATTPETVYAINSPEAILQWQQDASGWSFNGTREGVTLLPIDGIFPFPPFAYLSTSLLAAFEPQDLRKDQWVRQRMINGTLYYYPAKYKVGPSQATPAAPLSEGYVVMRLAEIYLLRAEASALQGKTAECIADFNLIRIRAGLDPLAGNLSSPLALEAVKQERRIELFCEWGHRWNDLRRWGIAAEIVGSSKGIAIPAHSLLYPIPAAELINNPGLHQHSGY